MPASATIWQVARGTLAPPTPAPLKDHPGPRPVSPEGPPDGLQVQDPEGTSLPLPSVGPSPDWVGRGEGKEG